LYTLSMRSICLFFPFKLAATDFIHHSQPPVRVNQIVLCNYHGLIKITMPNLVFQKGFNVCSISLSDFLSLFSVIYLDDILKYSERIRNLSHCSQKRCKLGFVT
jgi:hypothetical protein